jgi:hypothetical protein
VHAGDEVYTEAHSLLRSRRYRTAPDRIAHIVLVTVTEAAPLVSPVYSTGAGEEEVRARWLRHFDELNSRASDSSPPAG